MKTLTTLAFVTCATVAAAETPVLTVLTYDSFVAEWGPGPAIEKGFEATCGCDLQWQASGDAGTLLARMQLEGAGTDVDVVVGLDQHLLPQARATGMFAPAGVTASYDLPVAWTDDTFLPFDWGQFAFVSTVDVDAPASLAALADSDLKVVIQDPRSSTPGLGLALWVQAAYGPEATNLWQRLSDNVLTVTPGWSEAYSLFLAGEADAVLSYTTSPAYHIAAEQDETKLAWAFDEGHPLQIEVAALVGSSDNADLGRAFLTYLLSNEAQSVLPTTNWMFPAVTPTTGLPEAFGGLVRPSALMIPEAELTATRKAAVDAWQTGLSR